MHQCCYGYRFVLNRLVRKFKVISKSSFLLAVVHTPVLNCCDSFLTRLFSVCLFLEPSLSACASVPHDLEGAQFPCTDDCQVTFVNLKCDSSKKRRRGRKSPTKEVSHITAEFEMEMKEEETSGEFLVLDVFQRRLDGRRPMLGFVLFLAAQTPAMWTVCARR